MHVGNNICETFHVGLGKPIKEYNILRSMHEDFGRMNFTPSQTKILEVRFNISECVFEAVRACLAQPVACACHTPPNAQCSRHFSRGVRTRFGLQHSKSPFEEHILCSSFQNLRVPGAHTCIATERCGSHSARVSSSH
jgi:hypothetical protein